MNTACVDAAHGGNVRVLQFARELGYPWDIKVCLTAASRANWDIVRWALAQDPQCPCDKITRAQVAQVVIPLSYAQRHLEASSTRANIMEIVEIVEIVEIMENIE